MSKVLDKVQEALDAAVREDQWLRERVEDLETQLGRAIAELEEKTTLLHDLTREGG